MYSQKYDHLLLLSELGVLVFVHLFLLTLFGIHYYYYCIFKEYKVILTEVIL